MTDETKKKPATRRPRRMAREPGADNANEAIATDNAATPVSTPGRQKTKASLIEDLLASDDGATLDALCEVTGWLPHTCRAFLTGLRKKGKVIDRAKCEGGTSVYRFGEPASDPHASPDSEPVEQVSA